MKQPVIYVYQENKGGFGARNTGLDHMSGKYIAFFDCDDSWYSHHLQDCYDALESEPSVDWVFGPNRIIDLTDDGKEIAHSTFYNGDKPKPVLSLKTTRLGKLNVFDDPNTITCQMLHGLFAGQQFSLIRKEVFDGYRFRSEYRNEGADQVALITALSKGHKLAYLDDIHGTYVVHGNNASAGCKGASLEKYLRLRRALIRGFQEMREEIDLTPKESKVLDKKISQEYFWQIGYNLLWNSGQREEALENFRTGIKIYPYNILYWKTYLLALVKMCFSSNGKAAHKKTS